MTVIIPPSKQCIVPPPQIWLAGNTGRVISLFCQTPFNAREVARRVMVDQSCPTVPILISGLGMMRDS